MNKNIPLMLLFLLSISFVIAVQPNVVICTPSTMTNNSFFVNGTLNGTDGIYLYNISGDVYFNETKLNTTIQLFTAAVGNSSWNESRGNSIYTLLSQFNSTDNIYITHWLGNITLNETTLNATITTIASGFGGGNLSWNETRANTLYTLLSEFNITDNLYINHWLGNVTLNETILNNSIFAKGPSLNVNFSMYTNESNINAQNLTVNHSNSTTFWNGITNFTSLTNTHNHSYYNLTDTLFNSTDEAYINLLSGNVTLNETQLNTSIYDMGYKLNVNYSNITYTWAGLTSQTQITNVGTLTTLNVSGNATFGQNVSAMQFFGNLSYSYLLNTLFNGTSGRYIYLNGSGYVFFNDTLANQTYLINSSNMNFINITVNENAVFNTTNTTGVVTFLDDGGQVRHLGALATHIAEMQRDTLLDASGSSLSCVGGELNFTLSAIKGVGQLNFNGTIYAGNLSVPNATITLACGSDVAPKVNYVYWYLNAGVPTMTTAESYPSGEHIDVGTFMIGACSGTSYTTYSYDRNRYEIDTFVKNSLERWEETGTLYVSGFTPNASTTNLSVASGGEFFSNIIEITSANNVSLTEGFYFINSTGNFVQATSLASLTQYADGTAFTGVNERVNIVWGVVPTTPNSAGTVPATMRLVAILPNYPGAGLTYQNFANANADLYETANFYPPDTRVKTVFTPIARTILRTNTDVFEVFPNGKYFQDVRGRVTSGGSAPSVANNDHAQLNNLDYSVAGHTGFVYYTGSTSNVDLGSYNLTATSLTGLLPYTNLTGTLFNGTSNIYIYLNSTGYVKFNETKLNQTLLNINGNLTGNVTGLLFGNMTGMVTGNVTGNVTGLLFGNVTGNLTGETFTPSNNRTRYGSSSEASIYYNSTLGCLVIEG